MQAKHTPGPWALDNPASLIVRAPTRHRIAEVALVDVALMDNARANAALIAAAPDMLAALHDIVSASDANCGDSLANAINSARAAIARATGET